MVKNLPANAGDAGSIPGSGSYPGEGSGNPHQYSCLKNPMDRSLVGHKESDMTERLGTHFLHLSKHPSPPSCPHVSGLHHIPLP